MLKRVLLALTILCGVASNAHANDAVLFQVVNLDCQFCGEMEEEGATSELVATARSNGIDYKVIPFGPVNTVPGLHPHGAVTLFYVAARLAPEASPEIAAHMYRFFANADDKRGTEGRDQLFDTLSVVVGTSTESLRESYRLNASEAMDAWSRAASLIKQASGEAGFSELQTPSYILVKNGNIVGFSSWSGDVESTTKQVRKLIEGEG